jgi:bacterial/archaeal transporter family-2 protein
VPRAEVTRIMSRPVAILCTLAVGGLVALQPPANALLAKHVGDLGAAFVSVSISMAVVGIGLIVAGHPGRLNGLGSFKPEYALGGLAGAAVVTVSLVSVRSLGAGGVTALLVAAQLAVSLVADRYSWFGLHHVGLGAGRVAGFALVVGGTVLITR